MQRSPGGRGSKWYLYLVNLEPGGVPPFQSKTRMESCSLPGRNRMTEYLREILNQQLSLNSHDFGQEEAQEELNVSDSLWSLKIPGCPSKKSRGVTPAKICPLTSDHHGLLIIPIHWLASSLRLLSINKLVCGGRSGAIWLPLHHPGGCFTLVVVEEIPPLLCKALWVPRKALYKCN